MGKGDFYFLEYYLQLNKTAIDLIAHFDYLSLNMYNTAFYDVIYF